MLSVQKIGHIIYIRKSCSLLSIAQNLIKNSMHILVFLVEQCNLLSTIIHLSILSLSTRSSLCICTQKDTLQIYTEKIVSIS